MRVLIRKLMSHFLYFKFISEFTELLSWRKTRFSMPAPHFVKINVLTKWGGRGTWIETGTFLGDTTTQLAKVAESVITIEPSKKFFLLAGERMRDISNIQIIHGTSEDCLRSVLEKIVEEGKTKDVSFWLDGHFSQGETFKGITDTPILEELSIISDFLSLMSNVTILIDDVRLFRTDVKLSETYPDLRKLVDFATDRNLYWTIEADIFVITNKK